MMADTPAYYRHHLDELELVCQMLVRVLEGTPYSVVAKEFGVGHSAVEKRVKAVERRLRHLIGVTGAEREEPLSVHQMRALRQQYLNAIDAFRNTQVAEKKIRRQITEEDLARAAELTHRYSNCPTRDTALLYTLFATRAKPIEIARLRVRDYLTADDVPIEEEPRHVGGRVRGVVHVSQR